MHNDPFAQFSTLGLSLGTLEDAFPCAHGRACPTAPHNTAPPTTDAGAPADPPGDVDSHGERLLDGAELLRAVREPIEWLLTLAHRLAGGERDEVAAVDRLRAAFHARLAGHPLGVRMTDALVAFALLIGALDPQVVIEGVTRTVADGVATIVTLEGAALAVHLARVADRLPRLVVHHARMSRGRRGRSATSTSL